MVCLLKLVHYPFLLLSYNDTLYFTGLINVYGSIGLNGFLATIDTLVNFGLLAIDDALLSNGFIQEYDTLSAFGLLAEIGSLSVLGYYLFMIH